MTPRPPRTIRRRVFRILRIVLISYAGFLALLFLAQGWFVYPGRTTQGKQSAVVTAPPGTELVTLTTGEGTKIVALFGRAAGADPSHRATLLFFYGNGMSLAH